LGLANIRLIPFQPREVLPLVLASADVALIPLKRGLGTDSVPSKCYSILASGRPVIASVDQGTDIWNLVQRAECGLCTKPENSQSLANAVLEMYSDEASRALWGANGRAYVLKHHSKSSAAQDLHTLACRVLHREGASLPERMTYG
jgi:colanic acid biosynthesis glycosyl transferase WcaI